VLAALGVLGGFVLAAIGDMVSEEIRDRLDHVPHTILRVAARWLDPAQRVTIYDDEWLPELTYILTGDEARPVTRLYHGIRYALGILCSAHWIASQIDRATIDRATPEASFQKTGIITLRGQNTKGNLILSGVTGLGVGDEIRLGDLGKNLQTYAVMGVANDHHQWFVRRVRDWDADRRSQP
jgi:hypothetical protein